MQLNCSACKLPPGMTWTSRREFVTDAEQLAEQLSSVRPLRGVMGVPRSGLRAAAIVADYLQCPLGWATDSECEWLPASSTGFRLKKAQKVHVAGPIVLIEDSCWSGRSLRSALDCVRQANPESQVLSAVLYLKTTAPFQPDCFVRKIQAPAYHEYFVCGSEYASRAAWDIDGLLCRNPTRREVSSEDAYERFLRTVPCCRPVLPYPMGAVITARGERWRAITQEWLLQHGMHTLELVMHPNPPISGPPAPAAWKAEQWKLRPGLRWFMESESDQAAEISRLVGKTCVCIPTGAVFGAEFTREQG